MSMLFKVIGAQALADEFADAIKHAKGPKDYWVGSAVEYGPYLEFGSSRMAARPHWSTAIRLVAMKYELTGTSQGNQLVNEMLTAPRGLVKKVALDIERKTKQEITTQGAILTGNYRGSIATGPSEEVAHAASSALRTDK